MMGSLMADLKGVHNSINHFMKESGKPELTEDNLLVNLFEEVEYVWPKVGNPPLVTPFSQYVKNIALMNLLQLSQGKPRYSMMDKNMWDMILGRTGKLPGTLAPEILDLVKEKNYEMFEGNPQDNYPDELPKYRKLMEENGWDFGPDEEELFEYAMHERQYLDYKSSAAKKNFEKELESAKNQTNVQVVVKEAKVSQSPKEELIANTLQKEPDAKPVTATVSGSVIWEIAVNEPSMNPPIGTAYKTGEPVCYVAAYFGNEEIRSLFDGKLLSVIVKQGEKVNKGDIIAFIK